MYRSVASGRPQRAGTEFGVLEHFGVAKGDLCARRSIDCETDPSGDVLPEVADGPSSRCREHFDDGKFLDAANRRCVIGDETVANRGEFDRRTPRTVVEARQRPSGCAESSVEVLAVVQTRRQYGSVTGAPVGIGLDRDDTIGVRQDETGDRGDVGAVHLSNPASEPEAAAIPTFADADSQAVLPLAEERQDIDASANGVDVDSWSIRVRGRGRAQDDR